MRESDRQRATRWETLGAWLNVWTPPRDVEVPPRPGPRVLAALAAGLLVVVALVVALAVPALNETRAEREAEERRERDAIAAGIRARQQREQRPRFGRGTPPPEDASDERRLAARKALVVELERHVTADARRRFAEGTQSSKVSSTRCVRFPRSTETAGAEADLRARRGAYDCLARIRDIVRGGEQGDAPAGQLAYPFRAVVDFTTFRYAFCRIAPVPGEQIVPDPRRVIGLPRPCRAPRA